MKALRLGTFLSLLCLCFPLQAGELMEAARMIALSQGEILEEAISHNPERNCLTDEIILPQKERLASVENAKVQMSMEIKKLTGLGGRAEKRFIDYNRQGFDRKWKELIRPENEKERIEVMRHICSGMDQDTAIAFAGYMGKKNSEIYDYRRVTDQGGLTDEKYVNEIISADDYYQTHRNNEGIGDPEGRLKMGVCGDSAKMIADFLSHCGFRCEDIDILNYRTISSGHEMVVAKGKSGEYYTANWSEATAANNISPGQYQTPDPNITFAGPVMDVFDCRGRSKAKVTSPLGSILMMAHEDSHTLNFGQEYDELALIIEKLGGVDEVKLKAFRARANNGQKVEGVAVNVSHDFGDNMSLLQLEMNGSLVLAQAQRDIEQYEGQTAHLDQLILSPHLSSRLTINALRKRDLQAGVFIEADATGFVMRSEQTSSHDEHFLEKGQSEDQMLRAGAGAQAQWQSNNKLFSAEAGVRGYGARSVNQKGGIVEDGKVTRERVILQPDQVFARAQMDVVHDGSSFTRVNINYQNMLLVDRSQLDVSAAHQFKNSGISTGVSVIKNPGAETIRALNLGVAQRVRVRNNYVEISGGIQYLIIENFPNESLLSVSIVYNFE